MPVGAEELRTQARPVEPVDPFDAAEFGAESRHQADVTDQGPHPFDGRSDVGIHLDCGQGHGDQPRRRPGRGKPGSQTRWGSTRQRTRRSKSQLFGQHWTALRTPLRHGSDKTPVQRRNRVASRPLFAVEVTVVALVNETGFAPGARTGDE